MGVKERLHAHKGLGYEEKNRAVDKFCSCMNN
jgi:hypothetical protein